MARVVYCFFFFSSRRRHTRSYGDWFRRVLFRSGVWHETGIRKAFPPGGLAVRWRAPVGYGFSSPVIAEGRVYVTDALLDRPKVRGRVLCFEEKRSEERRVGESCSCGWARAV